MTTIEIHDSKHGQFLKSGDGYLIYVFKPSGHELIPLAESWPTSAQTWVRGWQRLEVSTPSAFTEGAGLDHDHFHIETRVRDGGNSHHVFWKVERANGDLVGFWSLYTYSGDKLADDYELDPSDLSAGQVPGIWAPAFLKSGREGGPLPSNSQLLIPGKGPIGNLSGGGP